MATRPIARDAVCRNHCHVSAIRSSDSNPRPPFRPTHPAVAALGWFGMTFLAAAIGSQAGPGSWYAGLNKPTWNPPNWVFGPVWTYLYLTMALAAWRVWRRGGWTNRRTPLLMYLLQLILNAFWSPIFFGLQQPGFAFAEILLLWAAIAGTLVLFLRVDRIAGILLVPYLAWVSFATFLNFTLWRLNP